ncbi:MAG: GMC family oxidoreductase, partial [Acidimicrobiales bacterium]
VWQNFHNHVLAGVIQECSQPVPPPHLNQSEVALFCKSDPGWVGPDLQIAFVTIPFDIIVGQQHPNSVSILPGVVRPMSRGWVRLAGTDPLAKPLVNPNYLSARSDLDRLTQGMEIARDIFATKAFAPWLSGEMSPGPSVASVEDMRQFVLSKADSYHHQVGSCKMGSDAMSVVDPATLSVYGVEGLRVADASVMPVVPSGNCHTGIVMIGERLADMLKREHQL